MKKYSFYLIAAMMLGSYNTASAQFSYDDEEIILEKANGEEEIFEVPEGMMMNVDSLLNEYNAKAYLTVDTACNMRDEIPEYPREVYVDRLKRLPTAMEMPWNEVVQKFIDRYATRNRRGVSYMLGAANFYMPIFEQALEVYGLPLELKYLPVIESALNPNAVSPVGATGLWQFMLATGKRYGLRITTMIDERRDPVKSSYAAAHYLSDLYKIFGDWNLVIASYNAGPENIKKAIHRAGGERDYWKIYPYLPNETRGYVPAFIAANYIMNYYCEHNICPMRSSVPEQTDTVMLYQNVHFKQVSEVLDLDIDQIRALNPQYRRDVVTGYSEPSDLRLPVDYIDAFIDKQNEIMAYDANTLSKRAEVEVNSDASARKNTTTTTTTRTSNTKVEREATPVKETKSRDSRSSRDSKSGRDSKKSKSGKDSKSSSKKKESSSSVTIKEGETLSHIAARNGTTVAKLKKLNGLSGDNIRAGKTLKVK